MSFVSNDTNDRKGIGKCLSTTTCSAPRDVTEVRRLPNLVFLDSTCSESRSRTLVERLEEVPIARICVGRQDTAHVEGPLRIQPFPSGPRTNTADTATSVEASSQILTPCLLAGPTGPSYTKAVLRATRRNNCSHASRSTASWKT